MAAYAAALARWNYSVVSYVKSAKNVENERGLYSIIRIEAAQYFVRLCRLDFSLYQVLPGHAIGAAGNLLQRPGCHHTPARLTAAGTHVDDVLAVADQGQGMIEYDHR